MSSRTGAGPPSGRLRARVAVKQGAALFGQLVFKSAVIGLLVYGGLLISIQLFGRYAVESNLNYYWYSFQHWFFYGLPEFIQSMRN